MMYAMRSNNGAAPAGKKQHLVLPNSFSFLVILVAVGVSYTFAPAFPFLSDLKWAFSQSDGLQARYAMVPLFKAMSAHSDDLYHFYVPRTNLPSQYEEIWREYEEFRNNHHVPSLGELDPEHQTVVDPSGEWKTLYLNIYGTDTCAAQYFPNTMKAIRESELPVLTIMFSRLASGQIIPPHKGSYSTSLRYHLALKVPNEKPGPFLDIRECYTCPNVRYEWTAGEEVFFDDTFPHYAENPTSEERVVLWLDLERPDLLGWRERLISRIINFGISKAKFRERLAMIEKTNQLVCG